MELIIAIGILVLVFLAGLVRLPGLWRGERHRELERTLSWLPFGPRFRVGLIRAQPTIQIGIGAVLLCVGAIGLSQLADGWAETAISALAIGFITAIVLSFVLAVTVLLFNRPKVLVPPYLRRPTRTDKQ